METLVETSKPERVPPPRPLVPLFPHVSAAPSTVGLYIMLAPWMPVGVLLPRQAGSEQNETTQLRQIIVGEGSCA